MDQDFNYELKLSRAFLFTDLAYIIAFLVVHGLLCALPVFAMIHYNRFNPILFAIIAAMNIFIFVIMIRSFPSKLYIGDGKIAFEEKQRLNRGEKSLRIMIMLESISAIEIKQSILEKLFGRCHIRVSGNPGYEIVSGALRGSEKPRLSRRYSFCGAKYSEALEALEPFGVIQE